MIHKSLQYLVIVKSDIGTWVSIKKWKNRYFIKIKKNTVQ